MYPQPFRSCETNDDSCISCWFVHHSLLSKQRIPRTHTKAHEQPHQYWHCSTSLFLHSFFRLGFLSLSTVGRVCLPRDVIGPSASVDTSHSPQPLSWGSGVWTFRESLHLVERKSPKRQFGDAFKSNLEIHKRPPPNPPNVSLGIRSSPTYKATSAASHSNPPHVRVGIRSSPTYKATSAAPHSNPPHVSVGMRSSPT